MFFFPEKKICVPTLPKIFGPITRNTLILLFGLITVQMQCVFLLISEMELATKCVIDMQGNQTILYHPSDRWVQTSQFQAEAFASSDSVTE